MEINVGKDVLLLSDIEWVKELGLSKSFLSWLYKRGRIFVDQFYSFVELSIEERLICCLQSYKDDHI